MRQLFRFVPRIHPETLAQTWWARPFAKHLLHPQLWRWRKEPVARGAAVGAFFAFVTPVAQIPLSIACALLLRVHLPTAVAATFVNTPLTFGPVYYSAYRMGSALTGVDASQTTEDVQRLVGMASAVGQAGFSLSEALLETLLGAGVFGVCAAGLAYVGTHSYWRLRALHRVRRIHAYRQTLCAGGNPSAPNLQLPWNSTAPRILPKRTEAPTCPGAPNGSEHQPR